MRMVVVFPLPLGPIKPKTLPSGTVRERSSTAVTSPKVLVTSEISTAGIGVRGVLLQSGIRRRLVHPGGNPGVWNRLMGSVRGAAHNPGPKFRQTAPEIRVSAQPRAGLGTLRSVPGATIVFWARLRPAHPGASLRIKKAVITAAGQSQRALPLQTLIDRDGQEKPVLSILIEQALAANVEEICVVVWPGDEAGYAAAAGRHAPSVRFVPQPEPKGYADAILCAREFTGAQPFLHMVGDHLYVSAGPEPSAHRLVALAEAAECSVSGVQSTRESLLPRFGTVAGRRVEGRSDLYRIDTVIEKPTPTEAEHRLMVPGIRAGYYLCFFGMHVLTPTVMDFLAPRVSLSAALAELARREQYLALERANRRYDIGVRYGLLTAQLALALSGRDRDEVLSQLVELLAMREMPAIGR